MLRRSGFKKPAYERKPPAPLTRAIRCGTYAHTQTVVTLEKQPHSVNPHLRNLARGEACTGLRYGGYCHCDPATTVLAHSNHLADGKGMARKARDERSAFLGADCHHFLDQSAATAEEKDAFFEAAHARTADRWAEIATDPMARPWKREAARWALDRLK